MSNTAPSRADPVVVFPLGRWCPPQETSQPHPPPDVFHEIFEEQEACRPIGLLFFKYLMKACSHFTSVILLIDSFWKSILQVCIWYWKLKMNGLQTILPLTCRSLCDKLDTIADFFLFFDDSPCLGTSNCRLNQCSEMHAEQTQHVTVHVDSWQLDRPRPELGPTHQKMKFLVARI